MNTDALSVVLFTLAGTDVTVGFALALAVALIGLLFLRRPHGNGPALRALAEAQRQANERLAGIDEAGAQMRDVARTLSDRQARGAFGEARMEAIVDDAMPARHRTYQATLSNGTRPDCLIRMARGVPPLVVDAKFPLEAWSAWRDARDERAQARAATRVKRDVALHVEAIATKYLLAGETHPTALMFVPSERQVADLAEHFPEIVSAARKVRVEIVGPSTLMLAIETVRALARGRVADGNGAALADGAARLGEAASAFTSELARLRAGHEALGRQVDALEQRHRALAREADAIARLEPLAPETAPVRVERAPRVVVR